MDIYRFIDELNLYLDTNKSNGLISIGGIVYLRDVIQTEVLKKHIAEIVQKEFRKDAKQIEKEG